MFPWIFRIALYIWSKDDNVREDSFGVTAHRLDNKCSTQLPSETSQPGNSFCAEFQSEPNPSETSCCSNRLSKADPCGDSFSASWLSDVLLPKLGRWSEEPELNTDILSLRLVSVQRYSTVYEQLKDKYGHYFCQVVFITDLNAIVNHLCHLFCRVCSMISFLNNWQSPAMERR